MKNQNCPKCGWPELILENTMFQDELFEEVSCPVCGYYDSKITSVIAESEKPADEDFEF